MSSKRIAFQGEPGANSHIACHEAYPDYEAVACGTFEDALSVVADRKVDLAMIPIENSVAGRVADIHHLIPEANLYIIGVTGDVTNIIPHGLPPKVIVEAIQKQLVNVES